MTWKEYIEKQKTKYVGRKVLFENQKYTIVDVDINGCLHIDRKTQHNDTTAVDWNDLEEIKTDFINRKE